MDDKIKKLEEKIDYYIKSINVADDLIKNETNKELIEALKINKSKLYEKLAKNSIKIELLK